MKLYMTSAVLTDQAVRVYPECPIWDGFEHQGSPYWCTAKGLLMLLGVREFPAFRSRTIVEFEVLGTFCHWRADGDTEVRA